LFFAVPAGVAGTPEPASMDETVTFFYYEDIGPAAEFYGEVLQLQKSMDEDWVKIYRISATSSVGIVLESRGFHSVSKDKPVMLSIVTGDVDAWYERLTGYDTVVVSPLPAPGETDDPEDPPVRGFVVEDPGGYTIEFFTWLSGE
jgi:hypothetical protein